jgi:hypothetical protein
MRKLISVGFVDLASLGASAVSARAGDEETGMAAGSETRCDRLFEKAASELDLQRELRHRGQEL